jgi:metal-responsive CopG/Arc/MetJ family transcriptional regulator
MRQENMLRRQLYLPRRLSNELKRRAEESKITESEIMREALTEYLAKERRKAAPPEENPVLKMKGIFSGNADCLHAGEKHDEIIYNPQSKE